MKQPNGIANIFDQLASAMKPYTKLLELSAIWVDGRRYEKGDKVYLDKSLESWTMDTNCYTHEIVKCMGTIGDSKHEVTFKDLKTGELLIITL